MSPTPPFSADLVEVRQSWWAKGLEALSSVGVPACLVLAVFVNQVYVIFAFALVGIGITLRTRRLSRPILREVKVRADATGVTVGDRFVPRSQIRAGFVVPGEAARVLLRRRFLPPIELQVTSKKTGRALLHAVGLDASQSVATFRTPNRMLLTPWFAPLLAAAVGVTLLALRGAGIHTLPAFLVLELLVVAFLFLPTRLDVGADVIVLRWFGRRRVIGYEDIEVVHRFERSLGQSRTVGLSIRLRTGEEVVVPITGRTRDGPNPNAVEVVQERIREALKTHRAGGAAADAALLRRGGRGIGEWVATLRTVGAGANVDMRTAPFPRERLFRIVEDPACASSDRAAAAIALGADLDDEGRARLGAIAQATAAPRLRIAIEKAASAVPLGELEDALAELQADEDERVASQSRPARASRRS
jgi:hypothetical protein